MYQKNMKYYNNVYVFSVIQSLRSKVGRICAGSLFKAVVITTKQSIINTANHQRTLITTPVLVVIHLSPVFATTTTTTATTIKAQIEWILVIQTGLHFNKARKILATTITIPTVIELARLLSSKPIVMLLLLLLFLLSRLAAGNAIEMITPGRRAARQT
jgi:hypothetical protein